jgi:hypothetical protein
MRWRVESKDGQRHLHHLFMVDRVSKQALFAETFAVVGA